MPDYIVTPSEVEERRQQEEQAAKEARSKELAKARYEKCKASEPEKPPKQKSINELMELERTGADLKPEEVERLAACRRKKADQQKARREQKKAGELKEKVS